MPTLVYNQYVIVCYIFHKMTLFRKKNLKLDIFFIFNFVKQLRFCCFKIEHTRDYSPRRSDFLSTFPWVNGQQELQTWYVSESLENHMLLVDAGGPSHLESS